MSLPLLGGILIWLAAIAWSDWTRHRIPNRWLVAMAVMLVLATGFGVHPMGLGPLAVAAGGILVLAAGFPLFAMGWVGAGDVKFLAVLGLLFGVSESLLLTWGGASLLAGVHVLAWRLLESYGWMVPVLRGLPLRLSPGDRDTSLRRRLPHGVHIAIAAAVVVIMQVQR